MPAGVTYDSISSTTLTSGQVEISLSSIPGTYTDLRIIGTFLHSSTNSNVNMRLNGNTGTNYSWGQLGSSYSWNQNNAVTSIIPLSFSNTIPGLAIIDIPNYAESSSQMAGKKISIKTYLGAGGGNIGIRHSSLFFAATGAITSISFRDASGTNLGIGSTLSIYGITRA